MSLVPFFRSGRDGGADERVGTDDTREKLDGVYAPYVTPEVKDRFKAALQQAEDWLYTEEGEDASKSQYVARLDELVKIGGPIKSRQREHEDRPRAERQLRETVSSFMDRVQNRDEAKYGHLEEADWEKVVAKCAEAEKWMGDKGAKQAERKRTEEPAVTSAEILKKREALVYDCVRPLSLFVQKGRASLMARRGCRRRCSTSRNRSRRRNRMPTRPTRAQRKATGAQRARRPRPR